METNFYLSHLNTKNKIQYSPEISKMEATMGKFVEECRSREASLSEDELKRKQSQYNYH